MNNIPRTNSFIEMTNRKFGHINYLIGNLDDLEVNPRYHNSTNR